MEKTLQELQKAFSDFKAEHQKQLDDIKKGINDPLQAQVVEKVSAQVDDLQKAVDQANIKLAAYEMAGAASGQKIKDPEYNTAFLAHMKKGDVQASLNKGQASEGGYLAPVEWDRTIGDKLVEISQMRAICFVQSISTAGFTKLFNLKGTASGWVGEKEARPDTSTPTFGQMTYTTGEIYANPSATQQMLDDAEINLETWLAGEVAQEFSFQEGIAFLTGNGTNKPTGLMTYIEGMANATTHPYGAIRKVASKNATTITSDSIIDLIYSLPGAFTGNARFIMNRATQGIVRKLKDGQGNYLWQPSFVAGQPATIAGYPLSEIPGMPDMVANATPILFGDFLRGYLIIDRVGVRVLRDPYTNKPFVNFYTTKRVGGGLLNPEPLRALSIEA